MKRLTLWMSVLILCLALVGVSQAVTYFVDVQEGNDGYNGLYEADQGDGINGPKHSINGAIAAASASDVISIAYANGNLYPDVSVNKNLVFKVTDPSLGMPLVNSWTSKSDHTLQNPLKLKIYLNLKSGNVVGGSNLVMASNSEVWRDDGVLDSQLQFQGPANFFYYGAGEVLTGFELPPSADQTNMRNFTSYFTAVPYWAVPPIWATPPAFFGSLPAGTKVKFSRDQYMTGILESGAYVDLNGNILSLKGSSTTPHQIRGDVKNTSIEPASLDFFLTSAGPVNVNEGAPGPWALPDVNVSSSSSVMATLSLNNTGTLGRVTCKTANAHVDVNGPWDIAGLTNLASGQIEVHNPTTMPPASSSPDGPGTNGITIRGQAVSSGAGGTTRFSNDGFTYVGGVNITNGLIVFNPANNLDVFITGNSQFIDGAFRLDPTTGTRNIYIGGALNQFSSASTRTDFSGTRMNRVTMIIAPAAGVTQQLLQGNKTETIWYGPFQTNNSAANPAVNFEQGVFRVLNNVLFEDGTNGQVKLNSCTLFVGGETAPFNGGGNFTNRSGYQTINGGRVAMNGNALQYVRGKGNFGRLEMNNDSQDPLASITIDGTVNITCTQELYLVKGLVNNDNNDPAGIDGDEVNVWNIIFNGNPYPTIVRVEGKLEEEPIFTSMINVIYFGGIKWAGEEIPRDGSTVPGNPLKLNNLFVQTTTGCGSLPRGGIIMGRWTTVHGELKINKDQVLLLKGNARLTLLGPVATLEGMLVSENDGFDSRLVLASPTGTVLTAGAGSTFPYLPTIEVAKGSNGNRILGFKGLVSPDLTGLTGIDLICDLFTRDLQGELGDLTFQANGTSQTSSLFAQFATIDQTKSHLDSVGTNTRATLTLGADMTQAGNLKHPALATISIGQYIYKIRGEQIDLQGSALTEGSTGKLFFVDGSKTVNLYVGSDPVINSNVEVSLSDSLQTLTLQSGLDGTIGVGADSLAITGDFILRRGRVVLASTPSDLLVVTGLPPAPSPMLALLGQNFYLYQGGSVVGAGMLYLNSTFTKMNWYIFQSPMLTNLWIQKSVDLLGEDGYGVTITGMYVHQNGTVDLNGVNLIIESSATFTRRDGNYEATTGWLWLRSRHFEVGRSSFNIPNFRIHAIGDHMTVSNDLGIYFTITQRLDIYPGDGYIFTHNRYMKVADGVTVRYHSGGFDQKPDYLGTIRLLTVSNLPRLMPTTVWPPNMPELVTDLEVLTWTNDPDRFLSPAYSNPFDVNAVNNVSPITLTENYQVNNSILLRNGRLVIAAGKTLTFAQGLDITRVDGGIFLNAGAGVSSKAGGYNVTYKNNGNQDIFGIPPTATVPNPPLPPAPPGDGFPFSYVVAGPELPNVVATLTFTRNRDFPNRFTVIPVGKEVTILGETTLIIRNNLSVQLNATMTVLSDVYFENESDVFSLATDPVCEFWSPLVFAGGRTPQMVYIPKDGIDIRPPQGVVLIPPPPGPARIKIAKDNPDDIVHVTGGNLRVDHISFCNGLLDTDDNNSIQIPAPAPGLGQGFDHDCMQSGNASHVIGRVMKKFMNAEIDAWSSNERQEFPVGSGGGKETPMYRPMAFTFRNEIGQVTIPHQLELTAQYLDRNPRGDKGLPIADNCNVTTQTYVPFCWFVETNGTYTQETFDLELKANGLMPDKNPADGIDGYENVDHLRILRRHGTLNEIENTWLLQGDCADYDNAQYTEGATVINEHSKGGLRQEGAIFTVGMPYGDLPVDKHFADKLIWDGNPYNAMTFYVTHAEYWSGKPLQPGDEIGIYDGGSCVGYVKLAKEITPENYAIVVCSKDDDPLDGIKNGYTESNKIFFRYWDSKSDTEYSVPDAFIFYYKVGSNDREYNVVFEQRSTRVELFKGEPRVGGQDIWLTKGWNIFSLAVDPRPNPSDPNSTKSLFDAAVPNIFGDGILNPIEPQLLKVQDEDGNTIEVILGSWGNNIGDWQKTEGYYVKVDQDVLLQVQSNELVDTPISISLGTGWNIISYPCLESQQDALEVLQSLIGLGVLDKAMDQYGHALEKLAFVTENNGWYNGIGSMQAGHGYYIKLKQPATLEITCPGQDQMPKLMAAKQQAAPKYFKREIGNPYMPMNIYLNDVKIEGKPLAMGDEIAAYDGDLLVGSVVVEHELSKEKPLALMAGMDDGSGNGFVKGNAIRFKVWKADVNQETEISMENVSYLNAETGALQGSQAFEPRATATVMINSSAQVVEIPQAFELNQNYPNPFNPSTLITFAVPNEANVKVQVYDITGKLVTTLVDTKMSAGYHNIEWTGTDSNGLRVATGIYFYKMTADNFVQTKKMLFAK